MTKKKIRLIRFLCLVILLSGGDNMDMSRLKRSTYPMPEDIEMLLKENEANVR